MWNLEWNLELVSQNTKCRFFKGEKHPDQLSRTRSMFIGHTSEVHLALSPVLLRLNTAGVLALLRTSAFSLFPGSLRQEKALSEHVH
jgi:hypothetical protein